MSGPKADQEDVHEVRSTRLVSLFVPTISSRSFLVMKLTPLHFLELLSHHPLQEDEAAESSDEDVGGGGAEGDVSKDSLIKKPKAAAKGKGKAAAPKAKAKAAPKKVKK